MRSFFRGFFVTILIVAIGFFGVTLYMNLGSDSEAKEALADLRNSNEKFQVLVIGVDSLNSKRAQNTRSDVMMLLDVDGDEQKASLVSIPRDSRVAIEGHGKTKINHAYAFGKADLALETVNENFDLNVPYYIVIDYAFVEDVVDILGGIDVYVPMDMDYEDPSADPPLSIHLKEGQQSLNGKEALQYLRFRKGYENADLDRVKAQQAFMSAFLEKLKSPKSVAKAPSLLMSFLDNAVTNMPVSKVSRMGLTAISTSRENFNTATLPGTPQMIENISYYLVDEDAADKVLRDLNIKEAR